MNVGFGYVITPNVSDSGTWSCLRYAAEWKQPTNATTRALITLLENDGNSSFAWITEWEAHLGGLKADGFISPCYKCGNPQQQGTNACSFTGYQYVLSRLWFNIESPSAWSSNPKDNTDFLISLINAAQAKCGLRWPYIGIITTLKDWNTITNGTTAFNTMSLGYKSYDGQANFNDFVPFGGWNNDTLMAKIYTVHVPTCALYVDNVYYVCDTRIPPLPC